MNSCKNDDPYQILGVTKNATTAEIKKAYRKLALKFHPDKQKGDEEEKVKAAAVFTKIANAYELLSSDDSRRKHDAKVATQSKPKPTGPKIPRNGFRRSSSYDDPFSSHSRDFSDPFELFERVFAKEFGFGQQTNEDQRTGRRGQRMGGFNDPFFDDAFDGFNSSFGMMDRMMHDMHNMRNQVSMMHDQMDSMRQNSLRGSRKGFHDVENSRGFSSSYQSSSSKSNGFGASESVSTTTRIINGRKQTVVERTVVRPNGSVEMHIKTSGDHEFPDRRKYLTSNLSSKSKSSGRLRRSSRRVSDEP